MALQPVASLVIVWIGHGASLDRRYKGRPLRPSAAALLARAAMELPALSALLSLVALVSAIGVSVTPTGQVPQCAVLNIAVTESLGPATVLVVAADDRGRPQSGAVLAVDRALNALPQLKRKLPLPSSKQTRK